MSLIHKALKKAQGSTPEEGGTVPIPEEELIENKKRFFSASFAPRTYILLLIALGALTFTVYVRFIKTDKAVPPKMIPAMGVPQLPPSAVGVGGMRRGAQRPTAMGSAKNGAVVVATPLATELKPLYDEAKALFSEDKFDEAIAKFNELLSLSPRSPSVLNSLGLAYKKKGDLAKAEVHYNQALQLEPNYSECLNNLGVLKAGQGDNISAIMNLKKAIRIEPSYADPYFNLAVVMEKESSFKSAVENYKAFLEYTKTEDQELKEAVRGRVEELVFRWEQE